MARSRRARNEKPGPAGFLVVDKPEGWTSHDVVDAARRWLGTRRVGHLGTLDPQATGVLPLAVREATKLVPYLEASRKRYVGTVCLGVETDTLDAQGRVVRTHEGALPERAVLEEALEGFKGDIEQVPPMYSAVKQGGVPLHRLARQGQEVERAPKKVRIHDLELLSFDGVEARIDVECSAGTYVRVLAADLGERLGCGAHLKSLRRTACGPFSEEVAATAEVLAAEAESGSLDARIVPPASALGWPTWTLSPTAEQRVRHGGDIPAGTVIRVAPGAKVAALDEQGTLVAILEMRADRRLWPVRVLRPAD
ncbi:MAG: tRNA pseudouridine(55) synthase TruB [Myxococcota bacterium]